MLNFRCGFLGTAWLNATLGTLLACGGSSSIPRDARDGSDRHGRAAYAARSSLGRSGANQPDAEQRIGKQRAALEPEAGRCHRHHARSRRQRLRQRRQLLIAPSNKVYLAFAGKVDLMTSRSSASGCILAEVAPSGGTPSCIDSELQSIDWNSNPTAASNPPVQFDSQGAIYYRGQGQNGSVLRKYLNGVKADLINDNIIINDFIVGLDGSVLITGTTFSSNSHWIRRITPAGGLQNLVTTTNAMFMSRYPDGDIYLGNLVRHLSGESTPSAPRPIPCPPPPPLYRPWPGRLYPTYDVAGLPELQGTNGALVRKSLVTTNGKSYAAVDNRGQYPFYQYYPTLSGTATMIKERLHRAGDLNQNRNRRIKRQQHQQASDLRHHHQHRTRLLPTNDIEIYHLNVDAAGNRVMFDGLNFADNKYVIGALDLATKALTLSPPRHRHPAKLTDSEPSTRTVFANEFLVEGRELRPPPRTSLSASRWGWR